MESGRIKTIPLLMWISTRNMYSNADPDLDSLIMMEKFFLPVNGVLAFILFLQRKRTVSLLAFSYKKQI